MSVIDEVLESNRKYAGTHELRHVSPRPKRRLAVLTCMDTRLEKQTLGLATGDAHILRNAGGIATDDMVRSLVVSHHLLGTEEIMVINHTDCGLMQRSEEELRRLVVARTGAEVPLDGFFSFTDVEENVRRQMQTLRSHPWIPAAVSIRGFVYEVNSGRLREIRGPVGQPAR